MEKNMIQGPGMVLDILALPASEEGGAEEALQRQLARRAPKSRRNEEAQDMQPAQPMAILPPPPQLPTPLLVPSRFAWHDSSPQSAASQGIEAGPGQRRTETPVRRSSENRDTQSCARDKKPLMPGAIRGETRRATANAHAPVTTAIDKPGDDHAADGDRPNTHGQECVRSPTAGTTSHISATDRRRHSQIETGPLPARMATAHLAAKKSPRPGEDDSPPSMLPSVPVEKKMPADTTPESSTAMPRPQQHVSRSEVSDMAKPVQEGLTWRFTQWGAEHSVHVQRQPSAADTQTVQWLLYPSDTLVQQHLLQHWPSGDPQQWSLRQNDEHRQGHRQQEPDEQEDA